MQREIEERMGGRVYEQFGLSEIIGPGVASACAHQPGLHVWEDHFIPEIIDPEGGAHLPDGEVGELVLTAATKEAFPVLRYRTRDRARLTRERSACGRTMARILEILGRTDDMLIVRGVNVLPSQPEPPLLGVRGLTPHQKLNATDDDSVDDLDRAATRAASDRKARAIIVRGLGRAFCTGIDLSALAGDRLGADWFRRWDVALAKIEAIPVATVAAIQGPCLGGGLQIILCCDLPVAGADATFGLSAVRHGIIPGLATYRLPRLIGMGAAREVMLLGETWDAARAHRQGLVNRVVPSDQLGATALDLAQQLASTVRAASVATKRLILRSHDLSLRRFLGEYVRSQRGCWNDRETRETLARYRTGRWGK